MSDCQTTATGPPEGRYCVRDCTRPRRHLTDCPDRDACPGCLPRDAEHGDLCWPCHRRLELMLADFPAVAVWLGGNKAGGSSSAARQDWQRPGGEDGAPVPVDLDVLDVSEEIRASLAGWVETLVEKTSLVGPEGSSVPVDAAYLRTHLTAVECSDFVAVMWSELAWLTSRAHALAPWRPEVRRLTGVPCPECLAAALVIFGGDVDVTCQACRAMIPEDRYGLWVKIGADEVRGETA